MEMLHMAVKREGSVLVGSDPIFPFNCFFLSILDPVRVFSMAFTSFTFAANLAFILVNASPLFTFTAFTSLFSLFLFLFPLRKFCFLYWQCLSYLLSLSLLLFEERLSPGEIFCFSFGFSVAVVFKEHIGGYCLCDQSHNGVLLEFLQRGLVFFGNFVR